MPRNGSQVSQSRSEPKQAEETGQIVRFRPRARVTEPLFPEPALSEPDTDDDLAQYEQDTEINYRQRMLMNAIAVVIVTMLIAIGVWIADTIAEMEKDQDCVLQGRGNCAPIEVPVPRSQ
jgi:hypothetical protein